MRIVGNSEPHETGPYIKSFLDAIGHVGLNNLLAAYPDKSAHAQAIIAFSLGPTHEPIVFVGRTPGKVDNLFLVSIHVHRLYLHGDRLILVGTPSSNPTDSTAPTPRFQRKRRTRSRTDIELWSCLPSMWRSTKTSSPRCSVQHSSGDWKEWKQHNSTVERGRQEDRQAPQLAHRPSTKPANAPSSNQTHRSASHSRCPQWQSVHSTAPRIPLASPSAQLEHVAYSHE
jgi:hypothetical protein